MLSGPEWIGVIAGSIAVLSPGAAALYQSGRLVQVVGDLKDEVKAMRVSRDNDRDALTELRTDVRNIKDDVREIKEELRERTP